MAFTFVVEDGTGLSNATSYADTTEADDYFAIDPNYLTTWTAKSTQDKQFALAWATRILDQRTHWNGQKHVDTSSLRWPRDWAYNKDQLLIANSIVPLQVKQAVCELSKYLNTNDLTNSPDTTNLSAVTVDVVTIKFQPGAVQSNVPSIINMILDPLGTMRVGGSKFVPINRV